MSREASGEAGGWCLAAAAGGACARTRGPGRVWTVLLPAGRSAQVARALGRALGEEGWEVTLAAGSLGRPGELTPAHCRIR